jgi:uncharacterized protein
MSAWRHLRIWLAAIAAGLAVVLASPAWAGDDDPSGTFLTVFPENDVYQVSVFGDDFAQGLLNGLVQAFNGDARLNIQRQAVPIAGVTMPDFDGKVASLEKTISAQPINIAVVMLGQDDRFMSLRGADGKRLPLGSEAWLIEYTRRVDRLMRAFKAKNAAVYWVGLPILARTDANELAQRMNDVIRERAYLNGYKYIDSYQGFTDENGAYSAYGPDLDGAMRVLRLRDGVNFTDAGNRKLAHFVEKELRPDLLQAKTNRNIPLLGAEAEQAKINPDNAEKTPAPSSPVARPTQQASKTPIVRGPAFDGAAPSSTGDSAAGDQKADDGKITLRIVGSNGREETQTIQIIRPAIPASVVALMARRDASGQRGDLLVDQIAGGVTLMSSISPSGNKDRGRLSPTQAPYFRLLVKGERLQPKAGRADDVTWPPKPDTTSEVKPSDLQPRG